MIYRDTCANSEQGKSSTRNGTVLCVATDLHSASITGQNIQDMKEFLI